MRNINPLLQTDFYKIVHHMAYPQGVSKMVSYWTPRMTRKEGMEEVVMFGLQYFIKEYLIHSFNKYFFQRKWEHVEQEYKRVIKFTMGEDYCDLSHLKQLHELGFLPIRIKAVAEGTLVPIKVPMLQITNTIDGFGWLVNYVETLMSCNLWQPMTSATIGYNYRKIIDKFYTMTGSVRPKATACGDFSMRGFSSVESAERSGAGHLLSFSSTATIPSILWLENYYNTNIEEEVVAMGTPSTEHSIMSAYGKKELECYRHLIGEVFPKGNISLVSDTYDYWNLITTVLPQLKDLIMGRDGKVIIRGDSGDPVKILCGELEIIDVKQMCDWVETIEDAKEVIRDTIAQQVEEETPHGECGDYSRSVYFTFDGKIYELEIEFNWNRYDKQYYYMDSCRVKKCEEATLTPAQKGTVELLWEIFGGTINEKGYKVLDSHIGTIYGDSITIERCEKICKQLEAKGFATENVTFGIGSFTYQYNTRDTFGFAQKCTHSVINKVETPIFKAPKTDTDNFKKSQKGMCVVFKENDKIVYKDGLTIEQANSFKDNLLETVFENGNLVKNYSLSEIRERLHGGKF